MAMRFLWAKFAFVIVSLVPALSFGWGELGHQTTARIAEIILEKKGYEKAKNLVLQIMGGEPMVVSSTFPDDVRSDGHFHAFGAHEALPNDPPKELQHDFDPYHYVTIPWGTQAKDLTGKMRPAKDAHVILSQVPTLLLQKSATREQKMIWFKYFVHMMGDVHQPLHVGGNEFDRGGNNCDVVWDPPGNTRRNSNLHSVWDGSLFDVVRDQYKAKHFGAWFGYREFAELLLADKKLVDAAKKEVDDGGMDPIGWYAEAQELHAVVYPGYDKKVHPKDSTYCQVSIDGGPKKKGEKYNAAKIPVLDEKYIEKALPVAEKQLIKGGYRLAMAIQKMAESDKFVPTKDTQDQLLRSLLIENSEAGK